MSTDLIRYALERALDRAVSTRRVSFTYDSFNDKVVFKSDGNLEGILCCMCHLRAHEREGEAGAGRPRGDCVVGVSAGSRGGSLASVPFR